MQIAAYITLAITIALSSTTLILSFCVSPGLSPNQRNVLHSIENTLNGLFVPELEIDSVIISQGLLRPLEECTNYVGSHIPYLDPSFNAEFTILDISGGLENLADSAGWTGVTTVLSSGNVSANGVTFEFSKQSITFDHCELYYLNVSSMALLVATNGTDELIFDDWSPSAFIGYSADSAVFAILDDNSLKIQSAPSVVHFREKRYNGTAIILRDSQSPLMEGDIFGITRSIQL